MEKLKRPCRSFSIDTNRKENGYPGNDDPDYESLDDSLGDENKKMVHGERHGDKPQDTARKQQNTIIATIGSGNNTTVKQSYTWY